MGVPLSPSSRDRCVFARGDFSPENTMISIYKFMQTALYIYKYRITMFYTQMYFNTKLIIICVTTFWEKN